MASLDGTSTSPECSPDQQASRSSVKHATILKQPKNEKFENEAKPVKYVVRGPHKKPFDVTFSELTALTGTKHDGDKPVMAYLPPYAITQMAEVMTFGAKKYGGFNYLGGLSYIRLLSACLRHVFSYLGGVDRDPETGLSHIAHAMCCLGMLLEMTQHHPELDDRFKGAKK